MTMTGPLTVALALYYFTAQLLTSFCQEAQEELACDRLRAENCIGELQNRYDEVISRGDNIDLVKLDRLCVGVTKGNNVTGCVLEASSACDPEDPWPMKHKWIELHLDIRALCNKVCPKYEKRERNASLCAKRVHYEDIAMGHFKSFCIALNSTRDCVNKYQSGCNFSLMGFAMRDLPPFVSSVHDICFKNCRDVDKLMAAARECAHTYDLAHIPARHERYKRCKYFSNFINCLKRTQITDSCLDLRELFEKVNGNYSTYMREHRRYCTSSATPYTDISWIRVMTLFLVFIISPWCR